MASIALYARYSSDMQSMASIDDQFRICRDQAARENWQVAGTYKDAAVSGASVTLRPGIQALLQDASAGKFEIVLAEALDRISRDQADVAILFKHLQFAGVKNRHAGRGRNLRTACRPQGHDECAVSQGPCRQDPSRPARAGGERQGRWRALLWL